ncbi:hypothetical protein [Fulvivirga ligni]|uniref:hypothetical protein n=1 Tax=Fulvivirga ligni TaxID=2904246 RepID=UPI001F39470C|nr:hypothetical protein [Fulvivirga ligni]UII21534.1 hypothetical protein LVD16_27275 [Fulvivirga ligni]
MMTLLTVISVQAQDFSSGWSQLVENSKVDSTTVIHNAKFIKEKRDSLLQVGYLPKDLNAPTEVDEQSYINALKQDFFDNQPPAEPSQEMSLPELNAQVDAPSLGNMKLPAYSISDMDYLYGYSLDEAMIDDMIESISQKGKAYLNSIIQEKSVGELQQIDVSPRPSIWDKLYFDGNIGASNFLNNDVIYLSPALGYQFWKSVSLGVGPDIQWNVTGDPQYPGSEVGVRTFVKAAFLKYRIYAQAEDIISEVNQEEQAQSSNHHFYFGGGYLLPVTSKIAVNISVLYNVNEEPNDQYFIHHSPWIFRLGISAFK